MIIVEIVAVLAVVVIAATWFVGSRRERWVPPQGPSAGAGRTPSGTPGGGAPAPE